MNFVSLCDRRIDQTNKMTRRHSYGSVTLSIVSIFDMHFRNYFRLKISRALPRLHRSCRRPPSGFRRVKGCDLGIPRAAFNIDAFGGCSAKVEAWHWREGWKIEGFVRCNRGPPLTYGLWNATLLIRLVMYKTCDQSLYAEYSAKVAAGKPPSLPKLCTIKITSK